MKKVKIDDKSKFMSAVFIVVIICGLVYFFGYKKFEDKTSRLNADSNALETRIASLEQYYLTEEQNKKDTEIMTKEIESIFSAYPGDARFEDGIYEAFNLYGGSMNTLEFESIGFSNPEATKIIPVETVTAAGIEGYDQQINFNQFDVSYKGKLTYEGLKSMVREIAAGDYNLAIGKMSYRIVDGGFISGDSLISFYSVDGANCEYTEPPVSSYETGLENLFGVHGTVITNADEETETE